MWKKFYSNLETGLPLDSLSSRDHWQVWKAWSLSKMLVLMFCVCKLQTNIDIDSNLKNPTLVRL